MHLAGTPYGDVHAFIERHRGEGVILFLECVGLSPPAALRALTQLRFAGWMDRVSGVLIGRSAYKGEVRDGDLTYDQALEAALGDLPFPVVVDADIGHVPPQLTLVQGALGTVLRDGDRDASGAWLVTQRWP
jgi:muramoyltetrapeptide carboxypeptidase LdcA involved in peptidoglycan recycling